jgi:hypothetical protein
MSQAENSTATTTGAPATSPAAPSPRISFQSAGAVRRPRTTPLAVPAVQAAHVTLISALAGLKPNRIIGSYAADRFDIMARTDHLKAVLAAVTAYTKAIVADTAYLAPIGYVADETGYLVDAASEITSALNSAVDKMLDDADEANPGAWLRARQAEVAR